MKLADVRAYFRDAIDRGAELKHYDVLNVEDIEAPVHLGNYNICWPPHWTEKDRKYWRAAMELPEVPMIDAHEKITPDWYGEYLKGKRREAARTRMR